MKTKNPKQTQQPPFADLLAAYRFDSNNRFEPAVKTVITKDTVKLVRDKRKYHYEFQLSRIRTPQAILTWTHQLCGKGWMDTASLKMFIETVANHNKIPLIES